MAQAPADRTFFHHANCLGCGTENRGSVGLRFSIDGDRVRTTTTLDDRHEGAPGFAHGGAVATALDDTLGTLLVVLRRPAVTAKLEVNYRAPAFLGREFELEAWTDSVDGRKIHLGAAMREGDVLIADAKALFLQVELEHFLQGGAEPPEQWKQRWRADPRLPY